MSETNVKTKKKKLCTKKKYFFFPRLYTMGAVQWQCLNHPIKLLSTRSRSLSRKSKWKKPTKTYIAEPSTNEIYRIVGIIRNWVLKQSQKQLMKRYKLHLNRHTTPARTNTALLFVKSSKNPAQHILRRRQQQQKPKKTIQVDKTENNRAKLKE